ncbi:MAG: mechanosensitive ion channel family protein [Planctomycetaceae bacterium]|nr:mechanosensitive ion channel family protein [Planctomycetaceae bacterium]
MADPNTIAMTTDAGSNAAHYNLFLQNVGAWLMTSGLRIFLILVLTLLAVKAIQVLVDKLFNRVFKNHKHDAELRKRADTLKMITRNITIILLVTIAVMTVLSELGVKIGPILTAAGVVGIAVGFGAQTLIKDLINGFFILLGDQIRVGDVVDIAGKSGLVEGVTLRMTTLRGGDGSVHFVRNGEITVVTNKTKEWSSYVFDIGVSYRENIDEVLREIKLVGDDLQSDPVLKDDILAPVEIFGLDKFADSAVIVKGRIKTKPSRQWAVGRQFNKQLKQRFDERNIEMPFPHLTLYAGADKAGKAPALNINLTKPE